MINQIFNYTLVTGCVLCLFLGTQPVAVASYVPPRTQKPPSDYSKTGGVRGCPEDQIPLTVFAPKKYVGETTSRYPTFAWFVSKSYQVQFRLFQFEPTGNIKQMGKTITLSSSPGINKYSQPENQPGLAVGQKYLWEVSIKCPQSDLIEAAEFTVNQIPSTLSSKLSTAKDPLEKVELYAQAGLWYDALESALKAEDKKHLKVVTNLLQDLAKSDELDATQQLTKQERDRIDKRINNLIQIANNQP